MNMTSSIISDRRAMGISLPEKLLMLALSYIASRKPEQGIGVAAVASSARTDVVRDAAPDVAAAEEEEASAESSSIGNFFALT